jgi:hypothetical protein
MDYTITEIHRRSDSHKLFIPSGLGVSGGAVVVGLNGESAVVQGCDRSPKAYE